ncbi:MAG: Transcriptional regulator MntR [Syntrophorhabdus sp. PtaB.Bin184]|jgi:DtxR family Mn-dependent transcriptional regulator|nr:MAG: Transcriptional regulator MntR [Syntrophorhabdus sp. PtaB.Bin184]
MSDDTLTASLEDYLEAIFHIVREKKAVKPRDIAKRLEVSYASVTGALRSLTEKDLINYAPYDLITLTGRGDEIARDVVRRHEVLRQFFLEVLMIPEGDADVAACKMEHYISKAIVERFIKFIEFVETCPRGGEEWIDNFSYRCDNRCEQGDCEKCMLDCLNELRKRDRDNLTRSMTIGELKDLEPGRRCRVVRIRESGGRNRRILDAGVSPGSVIEFERPVASRGLIDIKVNGYHLSLTRDETEGIEVEFI